MEHHEVSVGELGAEYLEWDATLVRSEEKDVIGVGRYRVGDVDRVRAMLDDVPDSEVVDAVPAS